MTAARFVAPRRRSSPFWALTLLLILAFLLGGASRGEAQSVLVLRPLSVLFLAYGLHGLTIRQVREFRFLFIMAAILIGWAAIQLVPLPPTIWSALPGRELVVHIDDAAGLGAVWRPISLSPSGTRNALFSLFLPTAVLVLGAQLDHNERADLLKVVLGVGLLSGLIAVMQISGPEDSPFYLYQITNNGSAVGLFANRNHHAIFLATLFPALAAFTARTTPKRGQLRRIVAASLALFLVPLILVTGSRAGLLIAALALIGSAFVYRRKASGLWGWTAPTIWMIAIMAIAGLTLLTIRLGRAEAFDRFVRLSPEDDLRYKAFRPIVQMMWQYFPVGAGFGAFRQVFQIDEPYQMLATTFFYHAHDDWLEAVLIGGLPAIVALGAAVAAYLRSVARLRASRHADDDPHLARAGACIILLLALASISDYPLRVPSISCLFVIAAMWMASFGRHDWRTVVKP